MTKLFKKSLAFVIAMALLVSALVIPGMVGASGDELDIWDSTFVKPAIGEDGFFEIYTPEELAWAVKNNGRWDVQTEQYTPAGAKFKLMNDIWLNDMIVTIVDGVPTATKATDTSVAIDLTSPDTNGLNQWFNTWDNPWFVAEIFDGQGHVVNGLYITAEKADVGLFPTFGSGVVLQNLGVENAYVKSTGGWENAIIVGSTHGATSKSTIKNCYTGLSTYHENTGTGGAILGGGGTGANVSDCYSLTTLNVKAGGGAIVGDSWNNSSMTRCYSYGYVPNRPGHDNPTCTYTFDEAPGASVVRNNDILLGAAYEVTDTFPVLKVFQENASKGWNGIYEDTFDADGDTIHEIYNASQFAFRIMPGKQWMKYILMNDIVINDIDVVITDGVAKVYDAAGAEITDFSNLQQWHTGQSANSNIKIDGNGYTLKGLFSTHTFAEGSNNNQGIALFNKAWDCDVANLRLSDMYLKVTGGTAAGIAANIWSQDFNDVESCYIDETCYIEGDHASGIFGSGAQDTGKASTVKNTAITATLKANGGKIGAITADVWGTTSSSWLISNTYSVSYPFWGNNAGATSMIHHQVSPANATGKAAVTNMSNLRNFYVTEGYPIPEVFVEDTSVWGGFLDGAFAGGSGTEEDPYLIATGGQLARAIIVGDGAKADNHLFYKLTADIYLNDITKVDWATGAVADGYIARDWFDDKTVQGTFEGDGHMVYGIYKKRNNATDWGVCGTALFPQVAANTTLNVHGIGVDYSFICGWHAGSAFVGAGVDSNDTSIYAIVTIDESFVGQNTTIKGYDAGAAIGINRGIKGTVTNFYSLATLIGHSKTGIVADMWGVAAVMDKVYNGNGSIDTKNNQSATNSYATVAGAGAVVVKQDGMIGDKANITMSGLGDKFVATEGYPILKLFAEEYDQSDVLGSAPFKGAGIEADPYLIENAEDLRNMVGLGGMGAYYELVGDIYVNDVKAVDWLTGTVNAGYTPEPWFKSINADGIGYVGFVDSYEEFDGTVNGNGYAIHGLYYEYANNSTIGGLVPFANNATFINLGIEDSFIGAGRFTGGFVGYGRNVNLSGCYIDDSCAVFGWDAGADYVTADGQIDSNNGGAKLCQGSIHHYEYAEDENGTYKLVDDAYVKIAEDEEYDGTRYSVSDIVWADNVHFTSNALAGLVARYITSGTIENCYVTATVSAVSVKAFGQEGKGVTWANPGKVGGAASGHVGGLWGDDWASGTTKIVTATDCFSLIRGHENANNAIFTDIYTVGDSAPAGITKVSLVVGSKGLDEMLGLDKDIWYAAKDSVKYPQLRIRGTVIGDVDENGVGAQLSDVVALRKGILKTIDAKNGDYNRDGKLSVFDLVALMTDAIENVAQEEANNAKLSATVYLSSAGSDAYVGSENAPVASLNKAIELVQDGGTIVVDGNVTVTSVPATDKTVHIQGGTLDFSGLASVNINTGLIFENGSAVKFANDSNVYANGNTFTINEGVTVTGTPNAIFGGGKNPVLSTNLTLKAGDFYQIYGGGYKSAVLADTNLVVSGTVNANLSLTAAGSSYIYGGGYQGDVFGNTNLTVSGKVNEPLDYTSHTAIARLYGGCSAATVHGKTNVNVSEKAEFNYIYGGGSGASAVKESTNVVFDAYAMSIYGGSGTVTETNVTVNGGWVHQVFGGCEGSSMTGNTFVTINGGTIDRRVVGGCYNNATRSGLSMNFNTEFYVTGTCTVTLRDEATYNLSGDDYGITALSRHKTNHDAENGILVFENTSLQNKLKNKLGIKWALGTLAPAADSQIIG